MSDDYLKIKEKHSKIYANFKNSYCSAFDCEIVWNSKGFNHIVYKSGGRERNREDQIIRFKYLELAKELVEHTNTFQEYEYIDSKNVYYWGLIAIYKNIKLKVIIKRNGKLGKLYFYSVIPHYVTSVKRDK